MDSAFSFSVRTKIILLVCFSIALAMTLSTGFGAWQEAARYARAKQDDMIAVAQTIAASAASATATRDARGAYAALAAVGRIRSLQYAEVRLEDGRTLADLGATERLASGISVDESAAPLGASALLGSSSMEAAADIRHAGERVGRVILVASLGDFSENVALALRATVAGAIVSMALSILLALRLQTSITRPLRCLAAAMGEVRSGHDYSRTVEIESKDEVGRLMLGFNEMLSEIRDRDAQIADHISGLENTVADRTREYRAAAAEAAAANAAKSSFLATMSHEIRTPLNGILITAELLAAADLPTRAQRHAQIVARSGKSLLAIINDILDMSKIEAGKMEVEELVVDPVETVDTVLRLFAEKAKEKKLDLAAHLDLATGARILGDPVRLGQVLGNLVNNALKFTDAGDVGVVIEKDATLPDAIRFSVADTGIGIPADKLDTIFESFSQADQTTTRQYGGTGLGLAIAHRLVAAMGGDLRVESQPGEGSRFFFSLRAAPPERVEKSPPVAGQVVRLLIDAGATRRSVELSLRHAGLQPTDAPGAHADVVVATAASLRGAKESVCGKTVIAISADVEKDADLIRSGAATHLIDWPVSRVELMSAIDGTADARAAARQPSKPALFAGLRALVADDNDVNREVAAAALAALGVDVAFALDGREAVAAATRERFDFILMDGSMPEMDGFDAARAIRRHESDAGAARTPIVALTAHVVGVAADAWRDAGMDGILHKPYTLDQLGAVIGRVAQPAGAAPVAAAAPETAAADTVLDATVLNGLREMGGASNGFIERISRLYREHAPRHLDTLVAAIARGDLDDVARAAHALKSMSYNVGAVRVAARAGELEKDARELASAPSASDVRELRASCEAAIEALNHCAA